MEIKSDTNHRQYLMALIKMGPEQRLLKAFELSSTTKTLFLSGLHKRFPEKTEIEIKEFTYNG